MIYHPVVSTSQQTAAGIRRTYNDNDEKVEASCDKKFKS